MTGTASRARPLLTTRFLLPLLLLLSHVARADGPAEIETFLQRHCADCHNSQTAEGGLDLSALEFRLSDSTTFDRWVKLHDRVQRGEMPPPEAATFGPGERARFQATLASALVDADLERQADGGRSVVRRLNRVEFEMLLRDMLGIPVRVRELLPPDGRGAGFDTVGAALNVSAVQMESYLEAIDLALAEATTLIEEPPRRIHRLTYLQTHGMMQEYRRSGPYYPQADGLAMFAPDFFSHFNSLLDQFVIAHSAQYRVRVSAYAIRTADPITLTVRMGGPGHKESDEVPKTLLGNVSVQTGDPQVFEFDSYLERGQMFRIYPSSLRKMRFEGPDWFLKQKDYEGPAVVVQWVEVDGPIFETWPPPSHQRLWAGVGLEPIPGVEQNDDPNAHLDEPPSEIAKPRLTQLPKSKQDKETGNRNIYDPKQGIGGELVYRRTRITAPLHPTRQLVSAQPRADAERLLRSLMAAVYRRETTAEDVQPYVTLVERWLDEGVPFEAAMRAGYKAVLTSPGCLYHQGDRISAPGHPELSDDDLAERLAFVFWNSLPDAELREAAERGELREAAGRRAQADRMLRDPRSERFLASFLGQWLDLRLIDFTSPDSDLYPEFDSLLEWSMVEETTGFFRELLHHNLSVRNVIDADFAILNDRLARHYGVPGVAGCEFRRVELPPGSPRGGVLTQASILKVTANGTTTSPVVRGKWVLERILGQPPDPPPPGVPAIEPDIRGATTVLQQLAAHRSVESCAGCHVKIDPPGVALEVFDVIGGWRDRYRALDPERSMDRVKYLPHAPPPPRYQAGLPVEGSDQLADGRRFTSIQEFQALLLADPDQIVRNIVGQLVTYSTGAPLSFADRTEVERILAATRGQEHGFRSLVLAVVESPLFSRK